MRSLEHIFQNIIGNAFKYTPEGKEISIEILEETKNVKVMVADQEMGIPKDDQAKLFERFHRANNVANIKGTGLGLNIVKKYLDELEGKISFSSAHRAFTSAVFPDPTGPPIPRRSAGFCMIFSYESLE